LSFSQRATCPPSAAVRQFSIADILELAEADMAGVGLAPRRSDAADVIYINAGVTRPVVSWLERLTDDRRLILPIRVSWLTIPPTQQAEPCFRSNGERPNFQFSV
jgi:protein-L-isoaspartate O-methyltransferase